MDASLTIDQGEVKGPIDAKGSLDLFVRFSAQRWMEEELCETGTKQNRVF